MDIFHFWWMLTEYFPSSITHIRNTQFGTHMNSGVEISYIYIPSLEFRLNVHRCRLYLSLKALQKDVNCAISLLTFAHGQKRICKLRSRFKLITWSPSNYMHHQFNSIQTKLCMQLNANKVKYDQTSEMSCIKLYYNHL